jgi:hypothetical protein
MPCVDDHSLVREELTLFVRRVAGLEVVADNSH